MYRELEPWLQQRGYAGVHTERMNTMAWDTSQLQLLQWAAPRLADVVGDVILSPDIRAGGRQSARSLHDEGLRNGGALCVQCARAHRHSAAP